MTGILGTIAGIFTSGFGIFKLVKIVGLYRKARKGAKEIKEAFTEGNEFITQLKKQRNLAEEIWKDKRITPEEKDAFIKHSAMTYKEAEEFYNATMDVINLFR